MPYPAWYGMLDPAFRVAEVVAVDGSPAPPEISERFQGRVFRLRELEERGIRIAGPRGWYYANGRDWRLDLARAA
jgi:hypothetical protein